MSANRYIRQVAFLAICLATTVILQGAQLPARVYTVADGLAGNYISCIVQDSHGFIWFCTDQGLSRFDGYQFQNFGMDQGLLGATSDLLETDGGEYWIASQHGVYHFKPAFSGGASPFKRFSPGDRRSATVLAPDGGGGVWCGTNRGLYLLDRAGVSGHSSDAGQWMLRFVDIGMADNWNDAIVEALLRDRDGVLWIAASSGLYRRFPDGRTKRYTTSNGLPHDHVLSLHRDRQGTLWAGTWDGLCRISLKRNPVNPSREGVDIGKIGLKGRRISALLESSDGRFWVGTDSGLSELLRRDSAPVFERQSTAHGPITKNLPSLMEDRLGNIWVGSMDGGAMKLANGGFVTYTAQNGLASEAIRSILEDREGTLCVVSDPPAFGDPATWVNWFDGQRFHSVRTNIPRDVRYGYGGWYQGTFQDHTGEWWVPTTAGIFGFPDVFRVAQLGTARPTALFKAEDAEAHEQMFRVFEDSRGDLWMGSDFDTNHHLTRWERATRSLRRYQEVPAGRLTTAFAEDRAGDVWVGFSEGGLARCHEGRLQFFGAAEAVPEGWIYALYLDRQGRLWIASGGGGVGRIDSPEAAVPVFTSITAAQGLSSNHARCITEDRWGRIYVGGPHGVDCFYPHMPLRVRHYTITDGLAPGVMWAAFRDRHGALWFGASGGLSRLEPQADQPEPAPPIVISALRIRGEQRPISALGETEISGLVLGANQNQVQVDFVGPHFNPSTPLRYQYRLENVDADWSKPGEDRSVNFATLSAGSYRFLVRAVTYDGVASEKPATLAFTILAPYWARWWFRMLAVVLLAATIYAVYRFRLARLLEVERLRTRIATDLHDDIGASLSRIAIMSEVLIQRAGSEKNGLTSQLSDIAAGAREMLASMSDIVWAINPSHDHLRDLAQRMRRFASDVLSARDIEFVFRAPADQDLKMDADTRRQLFLVFKEAINNIARHSGCKRAEIDLATGRDGLVLRIRDDGKGLAAASNGGHGLPSMQARAGTLGADIAIASQPGQGTSITLRVPK